MAGFFNNFMNKLTGTDDTWDESANNDYEYDAQVEDSYEEQAPVQNTTFYEPTMNTTPIQSVRREEQQVLILTPDSIRNSQLVCNHIRAGHTVICNIESVDRAVAQRVIDYISGAAYAIDGDVKPIDANRKTFVVAPRTVKLSNHDTLNEEQTQNQEIYHTMAQ